MKPVAGCLGPFLAAMDPKQWPGATRPFNLLLSLTLDSRPKVRKVAKNSIIEALAVLQSTEVHAAATQAVFKGKLLCRTGFQHAFQHATY